MIMKWRKKPVVIEAVLLTEDNIDQVFDWISKSGCAVYRRYDEPRVRIQTLEGAMTANIGEYIIKGVKGEFYPCKADIFHATYDRELEWDENI
jgi:hypothetical protein